VSPVLGRTPVRRALRCLDQVEVVDGADNWLDTRPPVAFRAEAPRCYVGDPQEWVLGARDVLIRQQRAVAVATKSSADRVFVAVVAMFAAVDAQHVRVVCKKISCQVEHAVLASRFVLAFAGSMVDPHLDWQARDGVGDMSSTLRLLELEVDLALSGEEQGTHRLAGAGQLAGDHDRRRDVVRGVSS
jgi:hypothetical protein